MSSNPGRPLPQLATPRKVLFTAFGGAIILLPTWVATWFGIDPRVALPAIFATIVLLLVILFRVSIRITSDASEVFRGTPEQLFQIATDIELNRQVHPERGKLISQMGPTGQPGSSYVTQISGWVWTTTVLSSDPPRKLVTTTAGPGTWRIDRELTYVPLAEGTRSELRVRVRMPLLYWLLQPVFKRGAKVEAG